MPIQRTHIVSAQDFFDEQSERWSDLYQADRHFSRRYGVLKGLIEEGLDGVSPGLALDAGCGSGIFSALLADLGWRVEAVDGSSEMLRAARAYCERRLGGRVDQIEFREMLLEHLAYSVGTFDLVLCLSTLEYIEGDRGVLMELAKVLKPGGCLVLSVPNKPGLVRRIERLVNPVRRVGGRSYIQFQRHQYAPQEIDAVLAGFGLNRRSYAFWGVGSRGLQTVALFNFLERGWWAAMYAAIYRKHYAV
jgi:2-polyprenyl-6-hydroxyphenyl methylase/3-demethylubiquinone-9 3-methyltransferase